MNQLEIRRDSLTVLDCSSASELGDLAEEAKAVLGYGVLLDAVSKAVTLDADKPLQSALSRLDIHPLNREDVAQYQTERRTEANKERLKEFLKDPDCAEGWYSSLTWQRQRVEDYTLPIPEFVLNKAVQIKRECPEAIIWVESLKVDPFLVATIPDGKYPAAETWRSPAEEFYVEVWEEPKFEGRLK